LTKLSNNIQHYSVQKTHVEADWGAKAEMI